MTADRTHPKSWITKGFFATALYNIVAFFLFSKLLTNDYLASLDPQVFSKLGWVSILLWGLAYGAVAKSYHHVPKLLTVFFIEKMVYTGMWIYWLAQNGSTLPEIFYKDFLTGTVLAIYGAGDFISGIFFLWVALNTRKNPAKKRNQHSVIN